MRSYGPRNLAINIWFGHKKTFNSSDCESTPYRDKEFVPLSEFHVSESLGPGLGYAGNFLFFLADLIKTGLHSHNVSLY